MLAFWAPKAHAIDAEAEPWYECERTDEEVEKGKRDYES
jgi:hypothetical protein